MWHVCLSIWYAINTKNTQYTQKYIRSLSLSLSIYLLNARWLHPQYYRMPCYKRCASDVWLNNCIKWIENVQTATATPQPSYLCRIKLMKMGFHPVSDIFLHFSHLLHSYRCRLDSKQPSSILFILVRSLYFPAGVNGFFNLTTLR